jgi:phage tail-like protein
MAATGTSPPVISASSFVISIDGVEVTFSELSGINSEVEAVEYISSDAQGNIVHTKQFGKTKPPKITLKRAVDDQGSGVIWAWHQLVLTGDPTASKSCSLALKDAQRNTLLTYTLENAWVSKIDISGLKSGQSEVVMETTEIVCDAISMQPGG